MPKIASIRAYEIIASGGTPSMESRVELDDGSIGISSVPFGASAGAHEAVVLFDGDKSRFRGKGMLTAVGNVNGELAGLLAGKETDDLPALDAAMMELDGTENKGRLGANAILSLSMAAHRAVAVSERKELHAFLKERYAFDHDAERLPYPMMVAIEGGRHADDSTDFQEYLIVPDGAPSAQEAVRWGVETMMALKDILKTEGLSTNVGNEGAFAPSGIRNNEQPLELIVKAIEKAGFKPGEDVKLAIDPATSEVYDNGMYRMPKDGKALNSQELIDLFLGWADRYPFLSMEDPLAEDDWEHWPRISEELRKRNILCIGDDLTVTNPARIERAIEEKAMTGLLVKLNQIGTVSETVVAMNMAHDNGMHTIVSHRGGGETNGTFMVDLGVAAGASFLKVGPTRGERVVKYNRLIAIEDKKNA